MTDLLSAPRGDLLRLIYDLVEQNNGLKDQVKRLTAEVVKLRKQLEKQGSSKGGNLPPFIKPNVKRKKKRSVRKKRAVNFARKRSKPDKHIFHSYDKCPKCNGALGKPSVAFARQVIDIPLPKAEVTEHVFFKRWCTNCKIRVYPKVDLKGKVIGKQRFGINITSLVSALNEEFVQSLPKIKSFLKIAYDLEVSEGGIVRLLHSTAEKGEPEYDSIKVKLKESDCVYADETGSRENGKNGYQWSFSNNKHQLLLYQRRRNKSVVREFTGEEGERSFFEGVMVSDFLGSYNEYSGFHQRCWVHLLRDIKDLKQMTGNKHPPLNIWAKRVKDIYEEAKDWKGPNPNLPLGLQADTRIKKEAYFKDKLRSACKPYTLKETLMTTLSIRMINSLSELFTFIRFEGVKSDNNQAERALRHSVIKRKISGGTRSVKGSHTREVLASLFGTWRLQGLNPLEQTSLMLARDPCQ